MMTRLGGPMSAAALLFIATPLAAQRSERRVIDRAAMASAGWHRLGELVAALPPGSVASVEGFNHELRGSRVGFLETNGVDATWVVRLDGQLTPLHVAGTWILDQLPVAITQLDSIVITEGPQLTHGRAALLGTIDLYTRRVRGGSIVGDYQHGDETGDPGPYRYTPRTTPNVEKLGPFTSGAAAFGRSAAAVDVAARYSSLNITDQRIGSRLGAAFPGYQSDVNSSGGSGVATFDVLGGRTYVVGGRGRFTGFLPTAANVDQQARVVTSHAGLAGSVVKSRRTWTYSASAGRIEVEPLGAIPLVTPRSQRDYIDAFVEGSISERWSAGIGTTSGRHEESSQTRRFTSNRGWLTLTQPAEVAALAIEHSAGRLRYSGSARLERAVGDSDRVSISLTRLDAWRFGDFAWMDRSSSDSSGTTAADLRADLVTRSIARIQPTWYARAFTYSGIGMDPVRGAAVGVSASTPLEARVRARLRGEITRLFGDPGTGEASTPGGYFEADLSARAAGGFLLSFAGRYAPRTHWSGSIEDVPALRRIDLSVNKSMWQERIRAQLVMRNLLNAGERTHPDGAQWNLRSHLAVTVALPSGAGR